MPETLKDIQSRLLDDLYDNMLLHLEVGLQLSHDVFKGREKPEAAINNLKQTTRWLLRIMAVYKAPQDYVTRHLGITDREQIPNVVWTEDRELLHRIFKKEYPHQVADLYSYLLLADGGLRIADEAEVVYRLAYLNLSLVRLFIKTGALLPKTYIPTVADEEFLITFPQWRVMRLEKWADQPPAVANLQLIDEVPSESCTCTCGNTNARLYADHVPFLMSCSKCNRYFFDRQELQLAGLPNDSIRV